MSYQQQQRVHRINPVDPHIIDVDADDEVVFVSEKRRNPPVNDNSVKQPDSAPPNPHRLPPPRVGAAETGMEIIVIDGDTPPRPKASIATNGHPTPRAIGKTTNPATEHNPKSPCPGEFTCGICFDEFPHGDGLSLGECDAIYCEECMVTYLQGVAAEKKYPVRCPGCKEELNPWLCAVALETSDKDAAEKLQQLAVEKMTVGGVKYCCNKTCNTPFEFAGGAEARVQCPLCHALTCGICGLPWHEGRTCAQAQGATQMAKLAKENNWRHCPSCSELIERIDGCNFVRCKCGTGFCFNCGVPYKKVGAAGGQMGGPRNSHGNPGCQCGLFQNMPRRPRPRPAGLANINGNAIRRRANEARNLFMLANAGRNAGAPVNNGIGVPGMAMNRRVRRVNGQVNRVWNL